MNCKLCPNMCGADRIIQTGLCRSYNDMVIARAAPHFFEEPPISGERGSGTVFFAGCTMRCCYCQNFQISRDGSKGKTVTPYELSEIFRRLEGQGVHNINLVTPTHFSHKIREALDIYRPDIPIVYNTSGFERPEIITELENYVDIYLTDFKYASNALSEKYSERKNYYDYCFASTVEMIRQKETVYDGGIMKRGVIVRHLILPGNINNSLEVIKIFSENFNIKNTVLSIMSQFTPTASSGSLNRTIKPVEYKMVLSQIEKAGIENCFVQELSSSGIEYVPVWDMV